MESINFYDNKNKMYEVLKLKKFDYEGMVVISTIGDGSCFFHAILNAVYRPYRKGYHVDPTGKKHYITKEEIVKKFRNELADDLKMPSKENPKFTNYDMLGGGYLKEMAKEVKGQCPYTLHQMVEVLRSGESVDNVYLEHISNRIQKDIYLLDYRQRDVQMTGDNLSLLQKGRESIVVLYTPGHYELVGLLEDGRVRLHFNPQHPFIAAIQKRQREKLKV